jgi:hypothetical protein
MLVRRKLNGYLAYYSRSQGLDSDNCPYITHNNCNIEPYKEGRKIKVSIFEF